MTDTPHIDPHRLSALELANAHMGGAPIEPKDVVARATSYHAFLTGKNAPAANPAAGSTAAAKTTAPATTAKAAPATGAAPAAKPGAAAPKTGAAATTAPKAGATTAPKAGATAAPKPAAKPGAAPALPPGDTKDPNGTHTFADVTAALQSVVAAGATRDEGKAAAYAIMDKSGGGAKFARDVKPATYDKVVAACATAVKTLKAKPAPAAEPEATDDFGGDEAAAPPVTSDDTVVDSDPPEQTGAGQDAEDA